MASTQKLKLIYKKLYACFGPQHWWPGESAFEVMVGAILTQNTNWQNVETAIRNLKQNKALAFPRLYRLPRKRLASMIRSAGYYNIKAKRLHNYLVFLAEAYGGNVRRMAVQSKDRLRGQLLQVNGIGPETADSMLLYALGKPVFVIDAYTKRIFSRHGLIKDGAGYDEAQNLFMQNLKNEVKLFNEYHALLVRLGKDFCLKNAPRCAACPLKDLEKED